MVSWKHGEYTNWNRNISESFIRKNNMTRKKNHYDKPKNPAKNKETNLKTNKQLQDNLQPLKSQTNGYLLGSMNLQGTNVKLIVHLEEVSNNDQSQDPSMCRALAFLQLPVVWVMVPYCICCFEHSRSCANLCKFLC
jgi:hypothetical protein